MLVGFMPKEDYLKMRNKVIGSVVIVLIVVASTVYFLIKEKPVSQIKEKDAVMRSINPRIGDIKVFISSTGMVQPQNRIEIKPPISGRLETLRVKEGEKISQGQTLALMSSTDRATLLDAARLKGQAALTYWQDVYKPIPLMAPISGEVIAVNFEPGQTLGLSDVVLVLSDRLIIKGQVDETDIGQVHSGQTVIVNLDAYPLEKVFGTIDHISYESKVVNNVTIYEVDILIKTVPDFFRSGMSANINILVNSRKGILTLPVDAVLYDDAGHPFVLVAGQGKAVPKNIPIEIGIKDDRRVEVLSGVSLTTSVVMKSKKYSLKTANVKGNPFMTQRQKKN